MIVTCDVPPILGSGSSDHQRTLRAPPSRGYSNHLHPLFPKTHTAKCWKFASSVLEVRKRLHLADTCTGTVYLTAVAHFQHWGRFIRSRLKDQVRRGLRLFAGELASSQTWIASWRRFRSLESCVYNGKLHPDRTTKLWKVRSFCGD